MKDSYSHSANDVVYIDENIPGPSDQSEDYYNLVNEYNSQLLHSCQCLRCTPILCNCLELSGGLINYNMLKDSDTGIVTYRLNNSENERTGAIIECNDLCKCPQDCGNRLVQKGPIDNLYVKLCNNELKGLGLFTDNLIKRGTFICEYAGELLTKDQALLRQSVNQVSGKLNYIFCLSEHVSDNTLQTFVDPSYFGNIGRYVNHSCEPNCQIIPVRVNSPIPKLAIFSTVDILPGTELTFDYGVNNQDLNSKIKKICLCESQHCKTVLPYSSY